MDSHDEQNTKVRNRLPVAAGCLTFALAFWLIERVEWNQRLGTAVSNLFEFAGVHRGYDDRVAQIVAVAWTELAAILLGAFLLARLISRCVAARRLPLRVGIALVGIIAAGAALGASNGDWPWRYGEGFVLFLLFAPIVLMAYMAWATRSFPKAMDLPCRAELLRLVIRFPQRVGGIALAAVFLAGCMASYSLDWSRQRKEAMEREDVLQSPFTQVPVPPPLSLRLLGEEWILRPVLYVHVPTDRVELARLRPLFPEAVIVENVSWDELNAALDAAVEEAAEADAHQAALGAPVTGQPAPATAP